MKERKFYNTKEDCIDNFIYKNQGAFCSGLKDEQELFKLMAEQLLDMLDSAVSSMDCEFDYYGYIEDFYYEIWVTMIIPFMSERKKMMDMLIDMRSKSSPEYIVIKEKED